MNLTDLTKILAESQASDRQTDDTITDFVFLLLLGWALSETKVRLTKTLFALIYGVDKKTINKWVYYFGRRIYPQYERWKRKRVFTPDDVQRILSCFGDGSLPFMSKKQIAEKADLTTNNLRQKVKLHPKSYGVTFEAYQALDKFPPRIYKRILGGIFPKNEN